MSTGNGFAGVSNCYVFKSRLQEYAQKVGIPTPTYETLKEGPSHEPCFRSTVIVNNFRYDSVPGFFNRKAAEQSAAEIALMELAKSGNMNECISHPVHETGLCKNLLQEYAQKMNYAIPLYVCHKDETPGKMPFSCTVEIGGIQYIGAAARTKKEAEIKAARTAILAIQSNTGGSELKPNGNSQLTVLPCKKKGAVSDNTHDEATKPLKPKKARFKKKWSKRRFPRNKGDQAKNDTAEQAIGNTEIASGVHIKDSGMLEANKDGQGVQNVGLELNQNVASGIQVEMSGRLVVEANQNLQDVWYGESSFNLNEQEVSVVDTNGNSQEGQATALNFNQDPQGISNRGIFSGVQVKDLVTLVTEVNKVCGLGQVAPMVTDSSMSAPEAPVVIGEHLLSKNHLEGEVKQRVGEQVQVPSEGYQPVELSHSEPVSEGLSGVGAGVYSPGSHA